MNKMENMEIKQLVVSMSLPIIISMVIQALYNIVDSIFVAKISSDALTAVSLCYPVQTIMIAIACGTAVGFNTLLARYLGEKKFDYANNTMMHGILLGFVNGLVFLVLGLLFSNVFLSLFTSDQNVIPLANTYIRILRCFRLVSLYKSSLKESCRQLEMPFTTWLCKEQEPLLILF